MVVDDVPQHWGISRGETDEFLLIGFLGAGKTTLLRRLLASPDLAQTAMLINEFGEIGLDHHLLERIDETVVLLRSGCLCCTIRGELAGAIRELQSRRERGTVPPFTRLVRESSGLADPFPVLTTLRADRVLRHHFRAGAIVTTVDAVNGQAQIRDHNETIQQIAVADQLVLTKTDLADETTVATLLEEVRGINPDAPLIRATAADLDVAALLDHERTASDFRSTDVPRETGHASRVCSFVVTVTELIDWTAFGIWLTMLLNRHGDKVLRVKGILNLSGEAAPVAIHGVRHLVHNPVHMNAWPHDDRRSLAAFNGLGA